MTATMHTSVRSGMAIAQPKTCKRMDNEAATTCLASRAQEIVNLLSEPDGLPELPDSDETRTRKIR